MDTETTTTTVSNYALSTTTSRTKNTRGEERVFAFEEGRTLYAVVDGTAYEVHYDGEQYPDIGIEYAQVIAGALVIKGTGQTDYWQILGRYDLEDFESSQLDGDGGQDWSDVTCGVFAHEGVCLVASYAKAMAELAAVAWSWNLTEQGNGVIDGEKFAGVKLGEVDTPEGELVAILNALNCELVDDTSILDYLPSFDAGATEYMREYSGGPVAVIDGNVYTADLSGWFNECEFNPMLGADAATFESTALERSAACLRLKCWEGKDWPQEGLCATGPEPENTEGVWAWDETHLLVGRCADELEIVSRGNFGG